MSLQTIVAVIIALAWGVIGGCQGGAGEQSGAPAGGDSASLAQAAVPESPQDPGPPGLPASGEPADSHPAVAAAPPNSAAVESDTGSGTESQPERSARAMPDFVLKDLDGRTVRLSDYTGHPVLINFWATWCAPCKAEIPELVEIQRKFEGDGFVILGVSLDHTGPEAVRRFAQTFGLNYRVLMGNPEVVAQYGNFRGIPASFLLNERHEQVRRYIGLITGGQLTRDIENLLASRA